MTKREMAVHQEVLAENKAMRKCLEKNIAVFKHLQPYTSNRGILPNCKCIDCENHRELGREIRRIQRTLGRK